jgi:threonine dehydrogenase-like Zn-dependent dehydrogenase
MKAALLFGPGDLRVVETEVPEPGPEEVLVRIVRFAPYGTDINVYQGDPRLPPPRYPMGIGADLSGVIAKVGPGVHGFQVGDRVSAAALAHCGRCASCRRGRTNRCLDPRFLNPPRQVACQEYAIVASGKLALIPERVSFDEAALLVASIDALNAWERLAPQPGDTLAVIGVGAMGLGAIATFRALGHPVIAIGGTGRRADLAAEMGCEQVIRLARHGEDVTGKVRELVPGGIDCVMETTATDWGVALATRIAAVGGRVALTGGGPVVATAWDLVFREISVFGVKAGTQQDQALRLIEQGRMRLTAAVTHRMPLDRAPEAFRLLAGPGRSDVGRILIDIHES